MKHCFSILNSYTKNFDSPKYIGRYFCGIILCPLSNFYENFETYAVLRMARLHFFGKTKLLWAKLFWLTSTLVKKKIGWEFRSTNLFRFSLVNKSIWTSRTTEHGNFRDDKAFEIEFLFLLVSCGETVIFPSLKKWCHDETFCLFKMHFFSSSCVVYPKRWLLNHQDHLSKSKKFLNFALYVVLQKHLNLSVSGH